MASPIDTHLLAAGLQLERGRGSLVRLLGLFPLFLPLLFNKASMVFKRNYGAAKQEGVATISDGFPTPPKTSSQGCVLFYPSKVWIAGILDEKKQRSWVMSCHEDQKELSK